MSFVYRNKFGSMRNAGLAWLAMIGCLAAFFWPHAIVEPPISHLRRLALGWVGTPVCLFIFVSFIREWIAGKPVFVVDENGVGVRQEPVIPWSEIESVRAFTRNNKPYLGIFPRNIDSLLIRYPEAAANRFRTVYEHMGAAAVVAQETLPKSIDDVIEEIDEFCRSKTSNG